MLQPLELSNEHTDALRFRRLKAELLQAFGVKVRFLPLRIQVRRAKRRHLLAHALEVAYITVSCRGSLL